MSHSCIVANSVSSKCRPALPNVTTCGMPRVILSVGTLMLLQKHIPRSRHDERINYMTFGGVELNLLIPVETAR